MSDKEELEGTEEGAATDKWKALRSFLKQKLIASEIPAEPKELRPKEVYLKYVW